MSTRTSRLAVLLAATSAGAALALTPAAAASPASDPGQAPGRSGGSAPVTGTSAGDRYIVVLEKGLSAQSRRDTHASARANGARIHHTYRAALDGFSATLPERALQALRKNPRVAFIEADQEVTVSDTQSPATWGIDRIDQRSLPLDNTYTTAETGDGVTAYIIDTGIRRTHAEFSGRATSGYTAINDGRGTDDCNGHGTHVAGTVGGETYGVAQDVSLVAVRVLDCQGSGSTSGVIAGVDWVTQNANGPAVANMSLGGGVSSALDNAVASSIQSGVSYAVAAGNDYGANACNGSPSRVAAALTVGSSTRTDARSSFSNIGSCLDLFAPGSDITSAWMTGDSAINTISGTSMATPHVAGVAALYLDANPSASAATVATAIKSNATPNKLTSVGTGSPNLLLHSTFGGTTPDPDPEPTGCDAMPEKATGTLSGSGDADYHPGTSGYFQAVAGTHKGCLAGPSGTDFDLHLEKWNGWRWVVVAEGVSASSQEQVTYTGTSGYYSWRVDSWSGSGSYTFGFDRP